VGTDRRILVVTQFYGALAQWWPLISPVDDYAEEADELRRVILEHMPRAHALLELGSGGGHVAFHLKKHFECCLTDISTDMLAMSRRLNPECIHVEGDMRSLALGRTFDIVLAHDAIDYMLSETDLARVCDTAWRHLRPGGLVVLLPDEVSETFEPGTDVSGSDGPDRRAVRVFEWAEAPRPGETRVAVHYSFLLRDASGDVRSVYERHECGLFPKATWTRLLTARGFAAGAIVERTTEERTPRYVFLGQKPTGTSETT
jgi:SAM-dependent methyltransferase